MTKVILSDLARTFLFVKDPNWTDTLNKLYAQLEASKQPYDFWEYFELDYDYLQLMEELKTNYQVHMFTSGYIQNHLELSRLLIPVFTEIFNEERVGSKKNNPQSYGFIALELGVNPDEILFIDDDANYVAAAEKAGLMVHNMKGLKQLKDFMYSSKLLI